MDDIKSVWSSMKAGEKKRAVMCAEDVDMPATIITGLRPGKTVLLTAGIHGCEYCSIQAGIELADELRPEEVSGTLLIIHIANPSGFKERLPEVVAEDGKNLNRVFPGKADGSKAERIAWHITALQKSSDFYIDMHGGDLHESMHPFVFIPGVAEESVTQAAREAAQTLSVDMRVRSRATTGAYNSAAILGVPSMLIERGGNGQISRTEVDAYKRDVRSVLAHLGVLPADRLIPPAQRPQQRELDSAVYLEADTEGCWHPCVAPGQPVLQGQPLGEVRTSFGEPCRQYVAERDGRVLYMTVSLAVEKGTPLVAYG